MQVNTKKKSPQYSDDFFIYNINQPNLPDVEAITNAPKVRMFPIVK